MDPDKVFVRTGSVTHQNRFAKNWLREARDRR